MGRGMMELRQLGQMWVGAFIAAILVQLFSKPVRPPVRCQGPQRRRASCECSWGIPICRHRTGRTNGAPWQGDRGQNL